MSFSHITGIDSYKPSTELIAKFKEAITATLSSGVLEFAGESSDETVINSIEEEVMTLIAYQGFDPLNVLKICAFIESDSALLKKDMYALISMFLHRGTGFFEADGKLKKCSPESTPIINGLLSKYYVQKQIIASQTTVCITLPRLAAAFPKVTSILLGRGRISRPVSNAYISKNIPQLSANCRSPIMFGMVDKGKNHSVHLLAGLILHALEEVKVIHSRTKKKNNSKVPLYSTMTDAEICEHNSTYWVAAYNNPVATDKARSEFTLKANKSSTWVDKLATLWVMSVDDTIAMIMDWFPKEAIASTS
jgi:hypothetical protein